MVHFFAVKVPSSNINLKKNTMLLIIKNKEKYIYLDRNSVYCKPNSFHMQPNARNNADRDNGIFPKNIKDYSIGLH
jgi:hypothetical protein